MPEYIEREAVLEKIARMINYAETNEMWRELTVLFQVGNAVMDCQAADVVPVRHGRWLRCGFGKEIMCSVCRCELDDVWKYRRCPNCGAKMDDIE